MESSLGSRRGDGRVDRGKRDWSDRDSWGATCRCIARVGLYVTNRFDAICYSKVQIRAVGVDLRIKEVEIGQWNVICHRYEPACVAIHDLHCPLSICCLRVSKISKKSTVTYRVPVTTVSVRSRHSVGRCRHGCSSGSADT